LEEQDHPDFWVLYSTVREGANFVDRFFILSHEEMAIAQARRTHPGDTEVVPYAERASRVARGVDNVLIKDVEAHESRWEKIAQWCAAT
jgi:hypothetical protein